MNWNNLKFHYLHLDRVQQLNMLAFNLVRIQVLVQNQTNRSVGRYLIRESQAFIEWFNQTINLETENIAFTTELLDLQRLLSQWKLNWSGVWTSDIERQAVAKLARHWCDRLHYYCKQLHESQPDRAVS